MEWIEDEEREMSYQDDNQAEFQEFITSLYNRSLKDVLSVDLWLKWCKWQTEMENIESMKPDDSKSFEALKKVRDLFEQAVVNVGLHIKQGSKIWDSYIDFESSLIGLVEDTFKDDPTQLATQIKKQQAK